MSQDLLSQLRDIHYPPPISIWPLAIGWYVVFALLVLLFLLAGYLWYRYIKRHRLKKIVLMRLEKLQTMQQNADIAEELSMLLKRAALAIYPRRDVAGLFGEPWLQFLDKTAMTTEFSNGFGRLLIVSPYQRKKQQLPDQLFDLIRNWVKKNL